MQFYGWATIWQGLLFGEYLLFWGSCIVRYCHGNVSSLVAVNFLGKLRSLLHRNISLLICLKILIFFLLFCHSQHYLLIVVSLLSLDLGLLKLLNICKTNTQLPNVNFVVSFERNTKIHIFPVRRGSFWISFKRIIVWIWSSTAVSLDDTLSRIELRFPIILLIQLRGIIINKWRIVDLGWLISWKKCESLLGCVDLLLKLEGKFEICVVDDFSRLLQLSVHSCAAESGTIQRWNTIIKR